MKRELSPEAEHAIIELAWDDRAPFEAIEAQFGMREPEVIGLMRRALKRSSFKMWRKRVSGRGAKHRRRGQPS